MAEGTILKIFISVAAALWAIALTGAGLAQPLRSDVSGSEAAVAQQQVASPDVAARR